MSSAPEGVCDGVQWGHFLTTFGSLFWTLSEFFLDHFRVTFLNTFRFFSWSLSGYFFVWWFCIFWKYIYKDFYYFSSHLCETFLAVAKCQNNFMFVENQEILCLKKIFSDNIFILEINILKIYIFCVFDGPISTSFAPLEIAEMSQQISKNQLKWSQRTPSHTLLRCATHHVRGSLFFSVSSCLTKSCTFTGTGGT